MDFPEPIARNEAILQNMLGADNELLPPMSRIETLLIALKDAIEDRFAPMVLTAPEEDNSVTITADIKDIYEAAKSGRTVFLDVVKNENYVARYLLTEARKLSSDIYIAEFSRTSINDGLETYIYCVSFSTVMQTSPIMSWHAP